MKGKSWFRMYVDFLEDPKVISLAFEDQRHFVAVCALKCSGVLDQDCKPEIMDRLVAQRLWVDPSAIREVKRRLVDAGLIDEGWCPLAWDRRQFVSDHDPTGAERQKRYRERHKLQQDQQTNNVNAQRNAQRNAPITPLETETETEKEKDIGREERDRATAKRFDEFWQAYPRKVAKPKAKDAWKRRNLDRHADRIIEDVEARKRGDPQWLEATKLIPHPTTYLNQERWTDEWRGPVKLVHSSGSPPESREAFIEACMRDSHMDQRAAAEYADERFRRLGRYFR